MRSVIPVVTMNPNNRPQHLKHGFVEDPCKQGHIPIYSINFDINANIKPPKMKPKKLAPCLPTNGSNINVSINESGNANAISINNISHDSKPLNGCK